ncbi:MAG: HpcH/HpaI aldolase/citrate lyase family protein [Steroidobacteraceae bacterium]
MQASPNLFKQRLIAGQRQLGLWSALADPYAIEILANAGYDWILIDNEHAPNDVRSTLAQLQVLAGYPVQAAVRIPSHDPALIKRYLDIGVQNLLVPMVDSAEQARAIVAAVRYPPRGIRGVGSALARASRWNRIDGYLSGADEGICLMLQVESVAGLAALADIAAVEGVDGVFFGPADLAGSMGHLGQPEHPDVLEAMREGMRTVVRAGKAAGTLSAQPQRAREYLEVGATFVAVGSDTTLLLRAASDLLAQFTGAAPAKTSGVY